ncbi:MAG: alanine--tRNA ligase [Clostridia bacterium]|nr:alanine--tRNA ligase [Clostridia bacterium]
MITDLDIKKKWFDFFTSHGFKRIDSASIIPENDATVLFTTAGMHPLVPYLLGEKHPAGNRLCDVQRCIRTNDIDEVGDDWHLTCFEMLGNWYLGSCPKDEMINLSFEFLTDKKYLGLDKSKLATTVFEGDKTAPRDEEAYAAWKSLGIERVFFLNKHENWWALGSGVGPCGPDSEMFLDTGKPLCNPDCNPSCDCGKYVEIWNDVFMQYKVKEVGKAAELLDNPNIDTGMGLERIVAILNGAKSVYDVGVFKDAIDFLSTKAKVDYTSNDRAKRSYRIIVDHIRAAVFVLGDKRGVVPSNVGQGYILRRFIRRSVNHARNIGLDTSNFDRLIDIFVDKHGVDYPDLAENRATIKEELFKEVEKFSKTLDEGRKEFDKVLISIEKHKEFAAKNGEKVENIISGKAAFRLFDTFGFPLEITKELASERGYTVDEADYNARFIEHQQKSRTAAAGTFKGGLADSSVESAKLHTATHLLHAALQKVLGQEAMQKGSNITPERLRFDFTCDHKMTPAEIKQTEDLVNEVIAKNIPVKCEEMTLDEAKKSGAIGVFEAKYSSKVKVYSIGDFSKEICGGPHANSTGELGHFKIVKEESSSSGVRRIKAVLEK